MDITRSTLHMETLVCSAGAQARVDCSVPLPDGRTAAAVLLAGAEVLATSGVCQDGGVDAAGTLLLHPLITDEKGEVSAFEATAEFTHRIDAEGAAAGHRAELAADLLECVLRARDGGLRLSAVVSLRITVFAPTQAAAISSIEGLTNAETQQAVVRGRERACVGRGQVLLREEVSLPRGMTLISATGTPLQRETVPAGDGASADGALNLQLLCVDADGSLIEHPCAVAYSGTVRCKPAEQLSTQATLVKLSVRQSDAETNIAEVEATIGCAVYGTLCAETPVLIDAYDAENCFVCRQEQAACACYAGEIAKRELVREQLHVPEHLPEAYIPICVRASAAVTGWSVENGTAEVDGILLVTVLYRCDGGLYHSFTEPVPVSIPASVGNATMLIPRLTVQSAQAAGSGRVLDVQLSVLLSGECYQEEAVTYTSELMPAPPEETPSGILLYFADAGETLFSVGKRFRLPLSAIRRMNPDLTEPLADGARIVMLK